MKRGYNELVGIQATFSRVISRYNFNHLYRWRHNGQTTSTGSMRGFDMHRHLPIAEICRSLCDTYAPAILSVWRQKTSACFTLFLQFEVGFTPQEAGLSGDWEHWAEL